MLLQAFEQGLVVQNMENTINAYPLDVNTNCLVLSTE